MKLTYFHYLVTTCWNSLVRELRKQYMHLTLDIGLVRQKFKKMKPVFPANHFYTILIERIL